MNKALFLTSIISLCVGVSYGQIDSPKPVVNKPTYFDISPPLREMAKNPNLKTTTAWKDGIVMNHERPGFEEGNGQNPEKQVTDPAVQNFPGYAPTGGITLGKVVYQENPKTYPSGENKIVLDGKYFNNGIYIVELLAGNKSYTQKISVMK